MSAALFYHRAPIGAWIEVTDEDSANFLQSQFSNDLTSGPGQATYGLWLDHRGKIQGDSTVLQIESERFYLHSAGTDSETLREKLESHIVADDVALVDRSAEVSGLVVWGASIASALENGRLALPAPTQFASTESLRIFSAHGAPRDAWQIVGPPGAVDALVEQLAAHGGTEVSADDFHFQRIEAGRPLVPAEVGPGETPIEAGLESACSWTKGCFLGQEVVARQHRLERRSNALTVVEIVGQVNGLPATLHADSSKVGSLRAVARSAERQLGLAMIKTRFRDHPNASEMRIDGEEATVRVAAV